MSDRKLATIQKIVSLTPIPDADKIETARVLNWDVVVKKGEFSVGNLAIYIEVDSFVPTQIAPFLTKEGKTAQEFKGVVGERIRTCRLKKQLSQGLILPLPTEYTKLSEGDDVTEKLGIIKYDTENVEEKQQEIKQTKFTKLLMKYSITRFLFGHLILSRNKGFKSTFPTYIVSKSDENRIQNLTRDFSTWKGTSDWSITEKLDGQSATFFLKRTRLKRTRFLLLKNSLFGVCSRNVWIKTSNYLSAYWTIAKKYNIEKILKSLRHDFAIQGEIIGPRIQGNKYKRNDLEFYVYTIRNISTGRYLNNQEIKDFCDYAHLKTVPMLSMDFTIPETIDEIVKSADGESVLEKGVIREGVVIRNNKYPKTSFKAISNEFLLKWKL